MLHRLAFDRKEKVSPKSAFIKARKVEEGYAKQLRKIARHIGDIVRGLHGDDPENAARTEEALRQYGEVIEPWAYSVATRMITEVAARDEKAWMSVARQMGMSLRRELDTAPTGFRMRELLDEQVGLIKSLPIEAAERVHKLTIEGITKGQRAAEISKEIMRSGEVSQARANTIARTEVGRTATTLTQARAESIGSVGYTWLTAGDSDVRKSHADMNGKFVAWNDPPTLDGLRGHAGALPNCRCTCIPQIPDL